MIRTILLDIEGTTTEIDFVHKVLFPYSAQKLEAFITQYGNTPEVISCIEEVKATVQNEEKTTIDTQRAVEVLQQWIQKDRKHTALKTLQGLIWKEGYETGAYQSHIYEDVPKALAHWKTEGLTLGIYSSGSVAAQKLLFQYTSFGDLTPYFSHYFDTRMGGKKEVASYEKIAKSLSLQPSEILFLSDMEAELEAASQAGFSVKLVDRKQEKPPSQFPTIETFDSLTKASFESLAVH
jgi:enolase-phosphatase E1